MQIIILKKTETHTSSDIRAPLWLWLHQKYCSYKEKALRMKSVIGASILSNILMTVPMMWAWPAPVWLTVQHHHLLIATIVTGSRLPMAIKFTPRITSPTPIRITSTSMLLTLLISSKGLWTGVYKKSELGLRKR